MCRDLNAQTISSPVNCSMFIADVRLPKISWNSGRLFHRLGPAVSKHRCKLPMKSFCLSKNVFLSAAILL